MDKPATSLVYIGTYADADEESIFLYHLNPETGELKRIMGFAGGKKTSYMALDKQHRYLYAINEQDDYEGKESGAVCSFSVDQQTGYLTFLNRVPTLGSLPVHIKICERDKTLLVANYRTGNVAAFPIKKNGQLARASDLKQHRGGGPNEARQESAHAHYITFSPNHRFVFVVDLGLDKVLQYHLDNTTKALSPADVPVAFTAKPGTGPRQLSFHPNGRFGYLIYELKPLVTALLYNSESGTFSEIHTIATVPDDYKGENKCGGISVSPDGKYLYGSNRGHDSIVVYAIDEDTGKLTHVENVRTGGEWPREFTTDLTGNILLVANQRSDNVVSFRIDKTTGKLKATGYLDEVEKPVFLLVAPA